MLGESRLPPSGFFVWTTTLEKILTLDNLRKRNVVVVECCYMCKKSVESIDHLLIHCEVARELWISILNLFGVDWVMPIQVSNLLVTYRCWLGCGNIMEVWRVTPLCLMWCLWRDRNAQSFEDIETSMSYGGSCSTFYIPGYQHIIACLFLVLQIFWTFVHCFFLIRGFSCILLV
jgi:hypothetical protein